MIKVLIADDETLVRAGIKAVLPWEENGFEVIGEAWNGEDAYNKIRSVRGRKIFCVYGKNSSLIRNRYV